MALVRVTAKGGTPSFFINPAHIVAAFECNEEEGKYTPYTKLTMSDGQELHVKETPLLINSRTVDPLR